MGRIAKPIEPLYSDTQPRRHVVIDTEATITAGHGGLEQRWALGVAAYITINRDDEWIVTDTVDYADTATMWADIHAFARGRGRTVVWAHGLPYDLRISRALEHLPLLGYTLQGIVLERTAAWASFEQRHDAKTTTTLMCCDLSSWISQPLARIATDLGLSQVPYDHDGPADTPALLARCRGDVYITTTALQELLAFTRRHRLGPFRPTGAGQAYAAWRRQFITTPVLVHDDTVALAHERKAMWTGRCEAWRWGQIKQGGLAEWDLRLAYCYVAHECHVPVALIRETGPIDYLEFSRLTRAGAVLADVTITTDHPVVPAGDGDRIHWPIGTFDSVLWDPELKAVAELGATVRIHRAWIYRKAPALQAFAHWILAGLNPDDTDLQPTPLQARLLKHWSRASVGRMALRYQRWERFGWSDEIDLRLGEHIDTIAGTVTDELRVGHDVMTLAEMAESDTSTPMITGWVMSEARRRLWRLMVTAGLENVLYVDTDSVIVTAPGNKRLHRAELQGETYSLIRKAPIRSLLIHGPRNLEVENERRISGLPTRAIRTGPLTYEGEVWSGVKSSMKSGTMDHVLVTPRTYTLQATDPRRHHNPDGTTSPHREEKSA